MLYHYTRTENFFWIAGIHPKNENRDSLDFKFRSFRIDEMHGQEELSYVFSFVRPLFKEVEMELNVPTRLQLSNLEMECSLMGQDFEYWNDFRNCQKALPHILCFSQSDRNSEFWYQGTPYPVCICFNKSKLSTLQHDNIFTYSNAISYGFDKNFAKGVIKDWYNNMMSLGVSKECIWNTIIEDKIKSLSAIRYFIFPFIKPQRFWREDEYRMMLIPSRNDYPICKSEDDRQYIEISITLDAIDCIKFWEEIPDNDICAIFDRLRRQYVVYLQDRVIYFKH